MLKAVPRVIFDFGCLRMGVFVRGPTSLLPKRLHFILESGHMRFAKYAVPEDIDAVVVSPGGVATTTIIKHFERFMQVNDAGNRDLLKHRIKPPSGPSRDVPALLITGETDEIIQSLERRDYLPHQAIRLGSPLYFLVPKFWREKVLARSINRQRRLWMRRYPNLLVLDYDEIWRNKEVIAQHFGIRDRKFIQQFPTRKKRSSI